MINGKRLAVFKTNKPFPCPREVQQYVKDAEEARKIALIKGYSFEGFIR